LFRSEIVDVVMTDQRMPEMSGVEFLGKARAQHPDAIRLLFTGYADIRAVIDAINQGNVYRYITKPWDPDELQTVIREACERHDLLAERQRLLTELKTKNEELEKANALQQAFIEVASHELRTPLTILSGLVGLSLRVQSLGEPLKDWLKRIDQAGQRLQMLVTQLVSMPGAKKFASATPASASMPAPKTSSSSRFSPAMTSHITHRGIMNMAERASAWG